MNSTKPCVSCKHLYYDLQDESYIECKKGLKQENPCPGYEHWDTNRDKKEE